MEILYILLGLIAGWVLHYIFIKSRNVGTLEIDMTNPNQHYHRLLLSEEQFSQIPKKKIVIFRVKTNGHFASVGNTAVNGNY